jgi:hypothetical protein
MMSVEEFLGYLLVHQSSEVLAVQLAEAYATRIAAHEARTQRQRVAVPA